MYITQFLVDRGSLVRIMIIIGIIKMVSVFIYIYTY